MSDQAVEILITNAIHTAFIKYPEGDGGPNLDYDWIAPDQSVHIAKAILQDLRPTDIRLSERAAPRPSGNERLLFGSGPAGYWKIGANGGLDASIAAGIV